jgi:hypothetical protein
MSRRKSRELTQQGRQSLQNKQRDQAAELLKQAVEEDENNIEAWELLVRALRDQNERQIALTTILQIDPDNRFARERMLGGFDDDDDDIYGNTDGDTDRDAGGPDNTLPDSVEQADADQRANKAKRAERRAADIARTADELIPGVSRREATLVGGGLAVLTLFVCVGILLFQNSVNASRAEQRRQLTQIAQEGTDVISTANARNTQVAETATQAEVLVQASITASFTPPSRTPRTPDLPPTFTPSPTVTEVSLRVADIPPQQFAGRIIGWGGDNPSSSEFLNLRSYDIRADNEFERLNGDLVQFVTADNQGNRLVYMRLLPRGGSSIREFNRARGFEEDISTRWTTEGILDARTPKLSSDGQMLVFSAASIGSNVSNIYMVDMQSFEVTQLTQGDAEYTTPAIAPDRSRVVAVRSAQGASDLVLIDTTDAANNFPQTPLTVNGIALTEAHPSFSADGRQVIFEAFGNDRENHDIYLIPTNARGGEVAIIRSPDDERYPVYSPDSSFIGYSRLTNDSYDIFVFELATSTAYQVSVSEQDVFGGAWIR